MTITNWQVNEVVQWLHENHLSTCAAAFQQHQIDGSRLFQLSNTDLDNMQIKALGKRKKILRSIAELKQASTQPNWLSKSSEPATEDDRLQDGQFDEAASHASFLEALKEWRQGTPSTQDQVSVGTTQVEKNVACWNCYQVFTITDPAAILSSKRQFCVRCTSTESSEKTIWNMDVTY